MSAVGLPWQFKLAAKVILARIPVGYRLWKKIGLFRLGGMERPDYALKVFRRHFDATDFAHKTGGFTALELGPGDSLSSAVVARTFGASNIYLVDAGDFACAPMSAYQQLTSRLTQLGLRPPDLTGCATRHDILVACSGEYLTEGLASLRKIPSASVDFVWSHAVLEHVRRHEFAPMLQELRRIQRPEGAGSHCISISGVLGGNLNDLRFSERLWESPFMVKSNFYTNRLRFGELLSLFRETGFQPKVHDLERWDTVPLSREKMASQFASLPDDDLRVIVFDVTLR